MTGPPLVADFSMRVKLAVQLRITKVKPLGPLRSEGLDCLFPGDS